MDEGAESVVLPCRTPRDLPEDTIVQWTRFEPDMLVHVYQNGSHNRRKQDMAYCHRTEMSEDPMNTGDLSLTLYHPTEKDSATYTCTIYRDKDILRQRVLLQLVRGQSCR